MRHAVRDAAARGSALYFGYVRSDGMRKTGDRINIVDTLCDIETCEEPFGKRWHQDEINLHPEHLAALVKSKILAFDVL